MDRDHLTRLIDDPSRVQRDDIADLKAMAERYPWFSGAHLLLAVGGHREGDVLFDEQLKASAAHLPSRAVLFDRLHTPMPLAPVPVIPVPRKEVISPPENQHEGAVRYPVVEEVAQSIPKKPLEVPIEAVAPPSPEPELPIVEETTTAAIAPIPAGPAVPEMEETIAEAISLAPPETLSPEHIPTPWKERLLRGDRDEEELDRQMRDSAVSISYELLLESEGLLDTSRVDPLPAVAQEPVLHIAPPSAAAAPISSTSRSFSDWLSAGSTDAPPNAAPASKEQEPGRQSHRAPGARPVVDPEIIRAVHQLGPIGPKSAEAGKHAPETPETKALIDRFLQQNAQVPQAPKKAEFFNPQTAAKRSLEEHADLVTETLARIYEKQGNIAKAIAAYERLAVKHPEKSAHFRTLAKALSGR